MEKFVSSKINLNLKNLLIQELFCLVKSNETLEKFSPWNTFFHQFRYHKYFKKLFELI